MPLLDCFVNTAIVMGNMMGNMMGPIDSGLPAILDQPIAVSGRHKANSYLAMLLSASEARGAAACSSC